MCIVCLFTVGVQHGADHHLHGVRHQDEKSTWKLQRGQVHRVHDVHHLHHLVGLCATLLRHRELLWGGLTCYMSYSSVRTGLKFSIIGILSFFLPSPKTVANFPCSPTIVELMIIQDEKRKTHSRCRHSDLLPTVITIDSTRTLKSVTFTSMFLELPLVFYFYYFRN